MNWRRAPPARAGRCRSFCVTSYDAWYVSVAEELDLPFATLDRALAKAHGPRCRFLLPPEAALRP